MNAHGGGGAGGVVLAGRQVTPEDLAKDIAIELARDEELPKLRETAEKWGQTVATLLGLFGIAGFIKGRDEISKLDEPAGAALGVVLLLAFILAAVSTGLAALAAQGIPRSILEDRVAANRRTAADNARVRINYSRWAIVPVMLLLPLAIGITWYAPQKEAGGAKYLVVQQSGVLCGELERRDDGTLAMKSNSTPLTNVTSMTAVDKCP